MAKNLPSMEEMQEIRVQSLDREDPLEEEMAAHPNFLAWKIPWTEEPGGLQSTGVAESQTQPGAGHRHRNGCATL